MRHAFGRSLLTIVVVLAGGCGADPPTHARETLMLRLSNGRELAFVVDLGDPIEQADPAWVAELSAGCPGDTQTLTVRNKGTDEVVHIGAPCRWWSIGPYSPDGRFLPAFRATDGAEGRLHLIELGDDPVDRGEVPHSATTGHTAAWTSDGRVWFTDDAEGIAEARRVWSLRPGDDDARPSTVPGLPTEVVLINTVRSTGRASR